METLLVHASRQGETKHERSYLSPVLAVAKARGLCKMGWEVHIADSHGKLFQLEKFGKLLEFDRRPAIEF